MIIHRPFRLFMLRRTFGFANSSISFTVQLIKEDFELSADVKIGDLVIADFDGYVNKPATKNGTVMGADGVPVFQMQVTPWACTGDTTPNLIYGWVITYSAADPLAVLGKFPAPVPMDAAGKGLSLTVLIPYGA